ncbi:MAG: hypothetical protein V1796_01935, partial [Pseudomonadota bacterium]
TTGANAASITDKNALTLATTNVGGALAATVAGGITQTGVVTVGGTTTLKADVNTEQVADLSTQTNSFGGAVSTVPGTGSWKQVLLKTGAGGLILGNITTTSATNSQISAITTGTLSGTGVLSVTGPSIAALPAPARNFTSGMVTLGSGGTVNSPTLTFDPKLSLLALTGASTAWTLGGLQATSTEAEQASARIIIDGVSIQAGAIGSTIAATIGSAQASALAAASGEAKKSFGTDSVSEQIDYGFAGDVGVAVTMAHEIPLEGETISVPACTTESKNSTPCK